MLSYCSNWLLEIKYFNDDTQKPWKEKVNKRKKWTKIKRQISTQHQQHKQKNAEVCEETCPVKYR